MDPATAGMIAALLGGLGGAAEGGLFDSRGTKKRRKQNERLDLAARQAQMADLQKLIEWSNNPNNALSTSMGGLLQQYRA